MRLAAIECCGPTGQVVRLEAHGKGALIIDRASPLALFVDIRDEGLPAHKGGPARLVAQIPTTWALLPAWEIEYADELRGSFEV